MPALAYDLLDRRVFHGGRSELNLYAIPKPLVNLAREVGASPFVVEVRPASGRAKRLKFNTEREARFVFNGIVKGMKET